MSRFSEMEAFVDMRKACEKIMEFHQNCFCTGFPLEIKGKRIDHTLLNEAQQLAEKALSKIDAK
jgi:hypothetical protein